MTTTTLTIEIPESQKANIISVTKSLGGKVVTPTKAKPVAKTTPKPKATKKTIKVAIKKPVKAPSPLEQALTAITKSYKRKGYKDSIAAPYCLVLTKSEIKITLRKYNDVINAAVVQKGKVLIRQTIKIKDLSVSAINDLLAAASKVKAKPGRPTTKPKPVKKAGRPTKLSLLRTRKTKKKVEVEKPSTKKTKAKAKPKPKPEPKVKPVETKANQVVQKGKQITVNLDGQTEFTLPNKQKVIITDALEGGYCQKLNDKTFMANPDDKNSFKIKELGLQVTIKY